MALKNETKCKVLAKLKDAFFIIRDGLCPTTTFIGEDCKRLNLIISVTPEEVAVWDRFIRVLEQPDGV